MTLPDQHALGLAQYRMRFRLELQRVGQKQRIDRVRGDRELGRVADEIAIAVLFGHQRAALRARVLQEGLRRTPATDLQQVGAEHVFEGRAHDRLFAGEQRTAQRTAEPVRQRLGIGWHCLRGYRWGATGATSAARSR